MKNITALALAGALALTSAGCVTDGTNTLGNSLATAANSIGTAIGSEVEKVAANPQLVPCLAAVGATLVGLALQTGGITGSVVGTNTKSINVATGLCQFKVAAGAPATAN